MAESNKTCAVIRHIHFEDLGSFAEPLASNGYEIIYLDPTRDELDAVESADLGVFLGGPIGVYDENVFPFLTEEIRIAAARLARNRPTLGICLGAQVLARAAGSRVYPGRRGAEIGWAPITLTAEGAAGPTAALAPAADTPAPMFHWHGDTFDLPADAVLLASSARYPNQIFSVGTHVLAFQSHPEFRPERIDQWLLGHAVELGKHGIDPLTVRADTRRYGPELVERGRATIRAWLAQ